MKSRIWVYGPAFLVLVFGVYMESDATEEDLWYEFVEEIAKDIRTPAKRSIAIEELSGIVNDSDKNMRLREYAAEKLGNLEAVEKKDMLKKLAEKLQFSDSERQLKRAATLAYWKIQVVDEPNEPARDRLLVKLLWGKTQPPPHADVVQSWAADELANRGVKDAMPEIIKSIKYRNSTKRGQEQIWLCRTKIKLLNSSESRCEALFKALLVTPDPTDYQRLKKWAVEELAKLKSCDGRWLLLSQALRLQNSCYDKKGKPIVSPTGRFAERAGISYREIIKILRDSGMEDREIKDMGLRPDDSFALR
jgi:hypothetical protein